jgi:DNA mismatch repair protein MutS
MSESTSIYYEYTQLTKQYQTSYGDNTIVLLQVGAFFEVYGFRCSESNDIVGSKISDFSQICNLNVSEKKVVYDDRQVLMAGFRDYTLDKYLQKISSAGYTAVVYVQQKIGSVITRVLDSVHSAGTFMAYETDPSQHITNNVACIWLDIHKPVLQNRSNAQYASKTRDTIICGVAIANIFTGKSYIAEFQQPFSIQPTTFDDLERVMSTHLPSEIILISPFDSGQIQSIIQYAGIQTRVVHRVDSRTSDKVANCIQQKYISHVLNSFYGEDALNTYGEFSVYPTATQSFCFLLDFVQEHNPNLVKNIAPPRFHTNTEVLLANHTLKQLNILDDPSNDGSQYGHLSSVNAFLNKCNTSMGRRKFYSQLVSPTTDTAWLRGEYDVTTEMLKPGCFETIAPIRKLLSQVRDVERICRQIVVRKVYPSSIYYLYQSVQITNNLFEMLSQNKRLTDYLTHTNCDISKICLRFTDFINTHFDIDKCKGVTTTTIFDENFIRAGFCSELDELSCEYATNNKLFKQLQHTLNDVIRSNDKTINSDVEYVKIHVTEKSGISMQITKKRGLILKTIAKQYGDTSIPNLPGVKWSDVKLVTASGSSDEIEIPYLTKICRDILHQKDAINRWIATAFQQLLALIETDYYEDLEQVASYLSRIDVLQTKAYIAKEYHYCCPVIAENAPKAFVDAKALRHVLIEHIQTNELYVANDIILGNNVQDGILLYGTNAVGKTSFIRALGIAIVMAQAGLFVPCSNFCYKPYNAIFSRILGTDNLFKGLSTFAVEMSELRVILRLADENSLILGDELCSGTETESALSIFVAGLSEMHANKSSHIFATHFHEIIHYDEIKDLTRLSLKHMAVHYDRELDALVYDRKLNDGPGNRMYGLEVCKSLHLSEDFLKRAYHIRSKYFPDTKGDLSNPSSRYNTSKIRGICELCENEMGAETHHLYAQADADEDGYIEQPDGSVSHKNHPGNLMSVCEKCHDQYHANGEDVVMLRKKTSRGYKIVS